MRNFDWAYLSPSSGIGGEIKFDAESFLVEEIMQDGTVLEKGKRVERGGEEGRFSHFVVQKSDWTTAAAVKEISRRLHVGQSRFDYAGTKDKTAVSVQLMSAFDIPPEKILAVRVKDIEILGAWGAAEKVKMGDLLGNRFTIGWRGENGDVEGRANAIHLELGGKFPNYFGPQRFGSTRHNTHIIGEMLVARQFEEAAMEFLCATAGELNEKSVGARKALGEHMDFARALREFPAHLRPERAMLSWLARNANDFVGAFRQLPRPTLLMFVHAFQSYLFNEMVSERVKGGEVAPEEGEYFCAEMGGFPMVEEKGDAWLCGRIIGYETVPNAREREILDKYGISPRDFKIKSVPEISSKGAYRALLAPYVGFSFTENKFRFSLPSGSYATSLLREFMDAKASL
ncbi:MAG TPA: tRNA pseudouridine(13) synthase TruD [Candidatus Bilamarchaeaceae archaeon]|nr:tRNA pseudouridine(13) synthase TruD [Candidatus Bilamarchaeaceae archaeon]